MLFAGGVILSFTATKFKDRQKKLRAPALYDTTLSKIDFLVPETEFNTFGFSSKPGKLPHKYWILLGDYRNPETGFARILFYPKEFRLLKTLDSINKNAIRKGVFNLWVKKYLYDENNISKFDIYAMFVDKKYDKWVDTWGNKEYNFTLPCEAEFYKKVPEGWRLFKRAHITEDNNCWDMFPELTFK